MELQAPCEKTFGGGDLRGSNGVSGVGTAGGGRAGGGVWWCGGGTASGRVMSLNISRVERRRLRLIQP